MPRTGKGFFLALLLVVSAHADTGRKGEWAWEDNNAFTQFEHGIVVVIMFVLPSCDKAALIVVNNSKITKIGLDVDGETWEAVNANKTTNGSWIPLGASALKHLKHGRNAALITDMGYLTMGLNGSATAINHAQANCEAMVPQPFQRLEPESVSEGTLAEGDRSAGVSPLFQEKSGNFFAVGNVVFYFREIVAGDDVRLKGIISNMENARTAFSSLVLVDNSGGNLGAAMRIGDFVREKGAKTAAYKVCASACIYAFAGGVVRTSYYDTRFGLHQVRYGDGSRGTLSEGQKIAAQRYEYLEGKGVHPKIAIWESQVEPESIRWISQYEAKGLELVTEIKESYDVALPNLDW